MVKLLKSEVLKMVEVHKPVIRLGLVAILIGIKRRIKNVEFKNQKNQ